MQNLTRRRTVILALYGSLVAGWLGFARWMAPAIIVAAHEGRSLPVLNRMVQGSGSPAPIERVLERWRDFSWAAAIAALFHLSIVLFIDHLNRRGGEHGAGRRSTGLIDGLTACSSW